MPVRGTPTKGQKQRVRMVSNCHLPKLHTFSPVAWDQRCKQSTPILFPKNPNQCLPPEVESAQLLSLYANPQVDEITLYTFGVPCMPSIPGVLAHSLTCDCNIVTKIVCFYLFFYWFSGLLVPRTMAFSVQQILVDVRGKHRGPDQHLVLCTRVFPARVLRAVSLSNRTRRSRQGLRRSFSLCCSWQSTTCCMTFETERAWLVLYCSQKMIHRQVRRPHPPLSANAKGEVLQRMETGSAMQGMGMRPGVEGWKRGLYCRGVMQAMARTEEMHGMGCEAVLQREMGQ